MTTPCAVFISGTGRTLRNLAAAIDDARLDADITLVVASRNCPGADWAREQGLPTHVQQGTPGAPACRALLEDAGAQWAVLAGYTRLLPIPPDFANRFVNIHPALLPSFGGPGMYGTKVHQAVLDAGCRVSGATVHLCDAAYDTGPIVAQQCCPVLEDDTPDSLAARVFQIECDIYPKALQTLFSGRFSISDRRVRIIT